MLQMEIKDFSHSGKTETVESGIVTIEQQNVGGKPTFQLVLRNFIGKILFTGFIRLKSKVAECKPDLKTASDSKMKEPSKCKKAQVSITTIYKNNEGKYEMCK